MLSKPKERGQGLAEYAFIISFVAIVVIAILIVLGQGVDGLYQQSIPVIVDTINSIIG